MILPELRDRAVIEYDELERELGELGAGAFNEAMRKLGYRDMVPAPNHERRAGVRRTCQASGCHKFVTGRYCPEHELERPAMGAAYKGRS